jgi:hypothetical protein
VREEEEEEEETDKTSRRDRRERREEKEEEKSEGNFRIKRSHVLRNSHICFCLYNLIIPL